MKKIIFILVITLFSQTVKAQYYGGYNPAAMDMALMQLQMENARNMAYQYQNMPPTMTYEQQSNFVQGQLQAIYDNTPHVITTPSDTPYQSNSSHNESSNYSRPCYTCRQTGTCPGCNGRGTIKAYTYNSTETPTCPSCHGSGRCKWCGGDGVKGN